MSRNKIFNELKKYNIEDLYRKYFLVKYQDSSYEQVIRILLEDRLIPFNLLEVEPIVYLWEKYDWARVIILDNIDIIISNNDYHKLSTIVDLTMSDKEQFMKLCQKIFSSKDIAQRVLLIDILLDHGFPASEELVINPLYQNSEDRKMEKNSLFDILEYRIDHPDIQEILFNA